MATLFLQQRTPDCVRFIRHGRAGRSSRMAVKQAVSSALGDALSAWSAAVDRDLDRRLGDRLNCPPRLREAMRYSVFAGGKRLRPLLVLLANEACLGAADAAM